MDLKKFKSEEKNKSIEEYGKKNVLLKNSNGSAKAGRKPIDPTQKSNNPITIYLTNVEMETFENKIPAGSKKGPFIKHLLKEHGFI